MFKKVKKAKTVENAETSENTEKVEKVDKVKDKSKSKVKKSLSIKDMTKKLNKPKTKKIKNETVISMDFGSKSVKLAVGKVHKNKIKIETVCEKKYPSNYYENGVFKEPEQMLNVMKEFFAESDIITKGKKIICTVESSSIIKREISVPTVDEEDMLDLVIYEMGQYLPINIDSYHFQYKTISTYEEEGINKTKVLCVVIPKEICKGYFDLVCDLKLTPYALDVHFNSIQKLLMFDPEYSDILQEKNIAVVDFGHQFTNVYLFENGEYSFNSLIENGGMAIDNVISQIYDLDLEAAAQKKNMLFETSTSYPLLSRTQDKEKEDVGEEKTSTELIETINVLIEEINKVIKYYNSRNSQNQVRHIFLCGGSSKLAGLVDYIESKLDIKTDMLHTFSCLEFAKGSEVIEKELPIYVNSIGAMIRK